MAKGKWLYKRFEDRVDASVFAYHIEDLAGWILREARKDNSRSGVANEFNLKRVFRSDVFKQLVGYPSLFFSTANKARKKCFFRSDRIDVLEWIVFSMKELLKVRLVCEGGLARKHTSDLYRAVVAALIYIRDYNYRYKKLLNPEWEDTDPGQESPLC